MAPLPDPSTRATADLVVLALTVTICAVVLIGLIGVVIVEAIHPEVDTSGDIQALGELASVMIGAVVGFVGGRGVGRNERRGDDDG